jgi:outer membrane protein assembly factor BamB
MKNLIYLLIFTLAISCTDNKNKIYQFRGEERKGVYDESNLLKEWPEEGPKELWTIETVGNGFCSPIFVDDRFYISGETDSMAIVYCFNLDGEMLWQSTLGREWMKSYPGSRMAPTIVGNRLYSGTGLGNLYCLDADNGDLIWYKDFDKDFQGTPMLHGYSEAPVIDGDKVFWTPGGEEFNVVGLNRFSGDLLWSNKGVGERSGYNQGQLISLETRNIYVTFSCYHLMGFDTETGELLWSHQQIIPPPERSRPGWNDTHSNSVLFDNGFIYYIAADGLGGVKLKLSDDGKEITQVWQNSRIDGLIGGFVKIGDYIFSESFNEPELRSIDANTGQIVDSLGIGSGAIIAADNMLYYYSSKGKLFLLNHNHGKLSEVSSFKITKGSLQHFSHPVIYKGVLYIRHGKVLMAYNIKA